MLLPIIYNKTYLVPKTLEGSSSIDFLDLFYFMNYQKIYDQIIERAKIRELEGYKEKHHIIPKCIGGGNERSNIVELTAREHFLCHWLLHEIYPNNYKLVYAFNKMCHTKSASAKNYIPSSRIVEYSRIKMAELNTGENNSFFGKKHSEETKQRIRQKVVGYVHTLEARSKMGRSRYGKDNPHFGKPSLMRRSIKDSSTNQIFESVFHAAQYYGITSAAIIYRIKSKNYNLEYI